MNQNNKHESKKQMEERKQVASTIERSQLKGNRATKMSKSKASQLCKLNFPIFQVKYILNDIFIISGGGGSSKTGVPNKIVFFQVYY